MNLDEFITETLTGTEKGVQEANSRSTSKSFSLTPLDSRIEFDIAVQVIKSNERDVNGKVDLNVAKLIQVAEVSVGGKEGSETSHTSRIKFKVKLERALK